MQPSIYKGLAIPKKRKDVLQQNMPNLLNGTRRNDQNREMEQAIYKEVLKSMQPREDFSNPLKIIEGAQKGAEQGGLLGGIGGAIGGLGKFAASPWGKRAIALGLSQDKPHIAEYISKVADLEETRNFQEDELRKTRATDLYKFRTGKQFEAFKADQKARQESIKQLKQEEKDVAKLGLEKEQYVQKTETGLRKEFNTLSSDFRIIRDQYKRIRVLSVESTPTAASDMSLIFSYMKMLDPNSVVRESEYATAQKAGSVPQRIIALYNRTLTGEKLSSKMRSDFVNNSSKIYGSLKKTYDKTGKQFSDIAKREGLDISNIIFEEEDFEPIPESETEQPTQGIGEKILRWAL